MNPSLQRRGETTRPPIFHDEKERRKKSPRIVVVGVSATRFLRVARAKFTPEDGRFESLTPKNDPSRWTCACRQTESLGGTVLVLRPASGPFVFSSLPLPPLFSLLLSFESIGCAHVNGNNSFSRTTIFFRNPSLSLSLPLSARAFRFPFQQTSINGSCQNVTCLAGRRREGGRWWPFAAILHGAPVWKSEDNWRMRIFKLGSLSLSSLFSSLLERGAQRSQFLFFRFLFSRGEGRRGVVLDRLINC